VVIRQGRIEQTGGHAELLREGGLYASLHARRFGESGEQPAMGDLGAAPEGRWMPATHGRVKRTKHGWDRR